MNWTRFIARFVLMLLLPLSCYAQATPGAPAQCPATFVKISPNTSTIRVKNTSGKVIVGLVFHVAISDATEHWKWLHWDYDVNKPLREFGWNKPIKPDAVKKLDWLGDLTSEHGAGGVFVLTSALFEDGSRWEERLDGSSCKAIWYSEHKKGLAKELDLPPRTP